MKENGYSRPSWPTLILADHVYHLRAILPGSHLVLCFSGVPRTRDPLWRTAFTFLELLCSYTWRTRVAKGFLSHKRDLTSDSQPPCLDLRQTGVIKTPKLPAARSKLPKFPPLPLFSLPCTPSWLPYFSWEHFPINLLHMHLWKLNLCLGLVAFEAFHKHYVINLPRWAGKHLYPYVTDEEAKAQRLHDLLGFTQMVRWTASTVVYWGCSYLQSRKTSRDSLGLCEPPCLSPMHIQFRLHLLHFINQNGSPLKIKFLFCVIRCWFTCFIYLKISIT